MENPRPMRLILSRKGFDSGSGGCPSPVFPDGSMLSLPIPDRGSPVRYCDLRWRGRDVGALVETLTAGNQRAGYRAHLHPDLRADIRSRPSGWKPVLGVRRAAQGHLRNQGVAKGDVFFFWGLFREVDDHLRWVGPPMHVIWGWLQIGVVAAVDDVVRPSLGTDEWRWASDHPHLAVVGDPNNTLYVAADRFHLPDMRDGKTPGAGVFDLFSPARRLTAPDAGRVSQWRLPAWFMPEGRPPLSYHGDTKRWTADRQYVQLDATSRGQEFVLDLDHYPEALEWMAGIVRPWKEQKI